MNKFARNIFSSISELSAKDLSEVVKNWATAATLLIGVVVSFWQGPDFIKHKKFEMIEERESIRLDGVKKRIDILAQIDSALKPLAREYEREYDKPVGVRSDAALDNIRIQIENRKKEQLRILNEIKVIMENQLSGQKRD